MKHSVGIVSGSILLITLLFNGCGAKSYRVKHSQQLHIETQPEGASVWLTDETGKHAAGTGPTELEVDFEADVGIYSRKQMIFPSLSIVAALGGVVSMAMLDSDRQDQHGTFGLGTMLLLGGIIGLAISLPGLWKSKKQEGQILKTYYHNITIGAQAEGYAPTSIDLRIPSQQNQLELRLVPQPPQKTEPPDPSPQEQTLPLPGNQNETQQDQEKTVSE